jgi:type II secretory pathway predicted ATPase ExeA
MTTPPILRLANAIRTALEDGHQGMFVYGSGRVGKTHAQRWLMERTSWHTESLVRIAVRVPRHTKIRDSYVYQLILMCLRQKLAAKQTDLEALGRIRDLFEQLCYAQGVRTLLVLVDEAQRLYRDEVADFLSVVNESEAWDITVFVVFVHQIDVTGTEAERAREQVPAHIKGRFGMANHRFFGLRGEDEVASVLRRYDQNAKWPTGTDITYCAHFAPQAFASGWRLEHHTKEILEVIASLRAAHGLAPLEEWPMKTFELFVQRILTRIACQPGFSALTREQIQEALEACGYIRFEFSRAHLQDDDEI